MKVLFNAAAVAAISAATVFASVQADAASPTVTRAIDTTVESVFVTNYPKEMRGGTWKVIYSSHAAAPCAA